MQDEQQLGDATEAEQATAADEAQDVESDDQVEATASDDVDADEDESSAAKAQEEAEEEPKDETASQARRRRRREAQQRAVERQQETERRIAALEARLAEIKDVDANEADDYDAAQRTNTANEVIRRMSAADRAQLEAEKSEAIKEAERARAESWAEAVQEMEKTYPDFRQVVSNPALPISAEMAAILQDMERGPEVAYTLASDPARLAEIARMPLTQQAIALGRVEGGLKPTPKPRTQTAVKRTLDEVSGSGQVKTNPTTYHEVRAMLGMDPNGPGAS